MLKKSVIFFILILILLTLHTVSAEEDSVIAYVGGVPITRAMAEQRASSGTAISGASALSDEEKAAVREEAIKQALFSLIAEQACINSLCKSINTY